MNRRLRSILLATGFVALFNQTVFADVFANSLWLGNDGFVSGNHTLYNVDRSGAILQSFPDSSMTGAAIDPTTNSIYLSAPDSPTTTIYRYDLNSMPSGVKPVPNGSVPGDHPYEDMAFNPGDPNHIWRANYYNHFYDYIDLTTGSATHFLSPLGDKGTPMGMAWDGTQFWVSDEQSHNIYTMTTGGVFSAPVFNTGFQTGGLAWDTTDGTLWVGGFDFVHHYKTDGTLLGKFATPNGSFVDGLEFQAAPVPEPGSIALLLTTVALLGFGFCRKQAAVHTDRPWTN